MIHITYTAENEKTGESIEFRHEYSGGARKNAIEQIRRWKKKQLSFYGLRLLLNCYSDDMLIYEHEILTGYRMHSAEILMALHDEWVTLKAYGKSMLTSKTEMNKILFEHVQDDFITLYYFTVLMK